MKSKLQQDIKNKLFQDDILVMSKISHPITFKNNNPELYNSIMQATSFLPEYAKLQERLYVILNNLSSIPKCAVCGEHVKFIDYHKGYRSTCSSICSNDSKYRSQLMLKVFEDPKKKQNVSNANRKHAKIKTENGVYKKVSEKLKLRFCDPEVKEKHRIGVIRYKESLTSEDRERIKVNLSNAHIKAKEDRLNYSRRYRKIVETKNEIGEDGLNTHQRASKKGLIKKMQTILPNGDNMITYASKKAMETKSNLYGYTFYNLDTAKKTWIQKYGVDNPFKTDSVIIASKEAMNKRLDIALSNYYDRCITEYQNLYPNLTVLTSKVEMLTSRSRVVKFQCTCGNTFETNIKTNGFYARCRICNSNKDTEQEQLYRTLQAYDETLSYGRFDIIKSEKGRAIELDIFSPKHKIAIEYNGLMWHSFGKSKWSQFNNVEDESFRKHSHLHKTEACEEQDISLYHIFDSEFVGRKKLIWESMIQNAFGKSTKIYARKCVVKTLTFNEMKDFLNDNHIQGYAVASHRYGLFYNNELVSVMTFGKSRFNKSTQYELIRFCNKLGHSVVGGASKLFKHFISTATPDSIISYANRRWSRGKLYENLNFQFVGKTECNYFFFKDDGILHNRLMFQKHRISENLEVYDPSLSDSENIFNNGYRKIYDCGNLIYIWRK